MLAARVARHSGLAPENLTTLARFFGFGGSSLPKSAGEPAMATPPRSVSAISTAGSARPATNRRERAKLTNGEKSLRLARADNYLAENNKPSHTSMPK